MHRLNRTLNGDSSTTNTPNTLMLLPNQIASRILDLELEYDSKNLTKDSLMELLSLYSQAVEFYEENRDKKFQVFQNRLTNVLKNPYVISILEEQSPNKIKEQKINELTKTAVSSAGFEATSLLSTFANQKEKAQIKIDQQLKSQKQKILQRVHNRSFNKSFTTNPETRSKDDSVDLVVPLSHELKPKPKLNVFLSFLDDRAQFQMPQRRKNIRAPNI